MFIHILLFLLTFQIHAEPPDWVSELPFTKDAFWGVGSGDSPEIARKKAKQDILMQLNSQVKAAVSLKTSGDASTDAAYEKLDAFFASNSLRGAELVDEYHENGRHWALMKYCDTCGQMLMSSAVKRYDATIKSDVQSLLDVLNDKRVKDAVKIKRRLNEIELEEYQSNYINVVPSQDRLTIMLLNFLPDRARLSEGQKDSLTVLSSTLLEELDELPIETLKVVGHANPTGKPNEKEELMRLSRNRAETMAQYLISSGFTVDTIDWKGGQECIGDITTQEGMSKNRRVEIVITFSS
jgi:outer membrane protein OmpA-like peptidoglycan-associated protein